MKTVTVSIGNSDNRLTQAEWSRFVDNVDFIIRTNGAQVHFMGGSATWAEWQNAAWIFECESGNIETIKSFLAHQRAVFSQDSIAWLEGETEFL